MELGLYIHFPFCASRCGYCDFYSTVEPVPHRDYADAVLAELERRGEEHSGRPGSIYIGGGTPSLWDSEEVGRVLAGVAARFAVDLGALELSLELNPGTASQRTMERLARAGVNRVSIGVQAMSDAALALLGRRHGVADAVSAVRRARGVGLSSVSCDLIFGLPGQSVEQHLDGLRRLLDLEPDHVSAYSLSLPVGSSLARRGLRPVETDVAAEMMAQGTEVLERSGFQQYEVSNFARGKRHRCRHNCGVWSGRPYLGLGAGACSMAWHGRENLRRANPPLAAYLDRAPAAVERVVEADAQFEMIFLGLRTVEGLDRWAFRERFGRDPAAVMGGRMEELVRLELLSVDKARIRPTARGILFADEIAVRLCR